MKKKNDINCFCLMRKHLVCCKLFEAIKLRKYETLLGDLVNIKLYLLSDIALTLDINKQLYC